MKKSRIPLRLLFICIIVLLLALFITIVILHDQSPVKIVKSDIFVQEFLNNNPEAVISNVYISEEMSSEIIEEIRNDCSNPELKEGDYYKIELESESTGVKVVAWVDWETKDVACIIKQGEILSGERETDSCEDYCLDSNRIYNGYYSEQDDSCYYNSTQYCPYGCSGGSCSTATRQEVLDYYNSYGVVRFSGSPRSVSCYELCGVEEGSIEGGRLQYQKSTSHCVNALFSDYLTDYGVAGDSVVFGEKIRCTGSVKISAPDLESLDCACLPIVSDSEGPIDNVFDRVATYQGSEDIILSNRPGQISCNTLCGEQESICISGLFSDYIADYGEANESVIKTIPVSCNQSVNITAPDLESLQCACVTGNNDMADYVNMFNSCSVVSYTIPLGDVNCNSVCGEQQKTCTGAVFADWVGEYGSTAIHSKLVECGEDVNIGAPDLEALYCNCC